MKQKTTPGVEAPDALETNTLTEVIKKRKSTRTYKPERLTPEHRKALEEFICQNNKGIGGEEINIIILEKAESEKQMKLAYGAIKGNHTYLLGVVKHNPETRLNYGYIMEKIVLKATELGVASCWIGYFDHDYFNDLNLEKGFVIPGLVIIGYAAQRSSRAEKLMRFAVSASQRLPWDKLFFDYQTKSPLLTETSSILINEPATSVEPQLINDYAESLEMLRLAPSSSNSQPWRIYFDKDANEFHFFKKPKSQIYERFGMHELDLGIAMAHFELTSQKNGLKGNWVRKQEGIAAPEEGLQYMISWKPGPFSPGEIC